MTEHKAGRELDALIETEIFENDIKWVLGNPRYVFEGYEKRSFLAAQVPHYSTQIADADLVLDKLVEMGHCPALIYDDDGRWGVAFDGMQNVREEGDPLCTSFFIEDDLMTDTRPLAICLSALKAVGEEHE